LTLTEYLATNVREAMESMEERITRLVIEYAQSPPAALPLDPRLSLRKDLSIDSLALVSLALRLGEEMSYDVAQMGIELGRLETLGDLVALGNAMAAEGRTQGGTAS
jgi:acyl carrier protein